VVDPRGCLAGPHSGTRSSSTFSSLEPQSSQLEASHAVATTKKQRQNKNKALAAKDAKSAAEKEREAKLAAHQRAKLDELYRTGERTITTPNQWQTVGRSKEVSGGMRAGVSENGQLIWE
jgi:hypothetical protein